MKRFVATAALLCSVLFAQAQTKAQPENAGFPFKNTSILKPPAGAKVAIYEFEDMECPSCAADAPIVRKAVVDYKIPYARHDFPLTEIHIWSFDAAVTARYIQDRISPELAEVFRRDVFANQRYIDSKDDLARFTRSWFQAHNQICPSSWMPAAPARMRSRPTAPWATGSTFTPLRASSSSPRKNGST